MFVLLAQFLSLFTLVWAFKRFMSKGDIGNIPGPKSESFIKGNMRQIFSASSVGWEFHSMMSEQYGRVARLWAEISGDLRPKGHAPYICQGEIPCFPAKTISCSSIDKDQVIYEETSSFFARSIVLFGRGIFTTQGEPHKKQRKMLNPVFSIAYMRNMIPIFSDIAKKIEKAMKIKLAEAQGAQEVDVLHWMSRAALEMIGQSGFGYSFDPLVEGAKPHPFCDAAKAFSLPQHSKLGLMEYLLPTIVKIGSPRFRRWLVDHFPSRRLRAYRDMVDTWHWTMTRIFEEKKRALMEGDEALANQVEQAKDLLSILIKANIDASEEDKVSDEEVLGQMSSFIFAATDTTSNALSRTLHLLASQPEIQERLRAEVTEAREAHGGDIPYDDLVSLPFMDAVCRETLRL
ncbi:Cytochrome P450 3A9 [Termitomyces sp. J132]|nr:Cytochrome P450 3A9 [Termitomyces sp. J132]